MSYIYWFALLPCHQKLKKEGRLPSSNCCSEKRKFVGGTRRYFNGYSADVYRMWTYEETQKEFITGCRRSVRPPALIQKSNNTRSHQIIRKQNQFFQEHPLRLKHFESKFIRKKEGRKEEAVCFFVCSTKGKRI